MSTTYEHHDPLLTDIEGCAILGIAKPTWHKWVRRGLIPKPVKLGHLSRWPRSEIVDVIKRAKAARQIAA
ncbi:helix-turn-helix domain-containing protein [Bradyrhizobium sp. BEA-2-5]|uniref:helix-turn-helix transcriptional regulator n=1 Tax=Bradyrhizobium sp. BEA-2-5 TaxID=3080015 RepID=UPI00293E635D|nr:helix-turn-helix domain-containing protein [Bradyrhizobium sp. BEA-2-5]WOH79008.1 helix-turn-helix domain-containing protein [Bradyrhizobium sp. BEA-2-5]